MTKVGKILVFLNLMFSFLVGTFAVMSYTARTHWADGYEKLKKSYDVLKATNDANKGEADRVTKQLEVQNQTVAESLKKEGMLDPKVDPAEAGKQVAMLMKRQKEENETLRRELTRATKAATDANSETDKAKASVAALQANVDRREKDYKSQQVVLNDEIDRNTKLSKGINEMRDRAVAAEIQSKATKMRNEQLEEQLRIAAADILKARANGTRTTAAGLPSGINPPPDQVEGLIQRVEGNLVTLTIGGDAGLLKGHTMEVFGLGANSGYRGKIRLVEVTPKSAVGEVIGKLSSRIKPGDTVASSIMGKQR
jgi:hypothetical protein